MANRNLTDYRLDEITSRLKDRIYDQLKRFYRRFAPDRLLVGRSYLLDDEWYIEQYPDVVDAKTTPTKHFLRHGHRENRDPGPFFSTTWYRSQYPDVASTDVNPLVHYLRVGEHEGRLTGPTFRRRRVVGKSPAKGMNEKLATKTRERLLHRFQEELKSFLASTEILEFKRKRPNTEQSLISVVMVTWNKAEFTLATLQNLLNSDYASLEVVVVDNGSTDQTRELLSRTRGLNIISNKENVGFVKAVNLGVAQATSDLVLLLNNDALPRPGAIARAAEYLRAEEGVVAVGGRLILPSGLLQEAGSIIWRDGSCQGYLRNEPPEIGEAMFSREVDYCSAAFLMFKKNEWDAEGGFNEIYSPAYYEEVDLCCRWLEKGLVIRYLPDVAIDHFEFASTSGMSAAAEMQSSRREMFRDLNEGFLQKQLPANEANVIAARQRGHKKRVLIIDDQIPRESAGQGFPRIVRLTRLLEDLGFQVCIAATAHEGAVNWPEIWGELGTNVECIPDLSPRNLEAFLEERSGQYELLWVSRTHNLGYLIDIMKRRPGIVTAPLIYDAEALVTTNSLVSEGAQIDFNELALAAKAETEATLVADAIVCVSALDADIFRQNTGLPVVVAAHSLQVQPGANAFGDRRGVLFFGALTNVKSPNVESIDWFLSDVWPLISEETRQAHPLYIAGQILPSLANKWSSPNVKVLGLIPDLYSLANEKRAFIAPTRRAQGIPIKVLQASAYGLPSVITPILGQQLEWQNDNQALIAGTAQEFAQALSTLLADESVWSKLRERSITSVAEIIDPGKFNQAVERALGFTNV